MHLPAEQVVNGLIGRLADDVPARHLERAQHAHQREIGMLREAARIDAAPHGFDRMRILALEIACRRHPRASSQRDRGGTGTQYASPIPDECCRPVVSLTKTKYRPPKCGRRVAPYDEAS